MTSTILPRGILRGLASPPGLVADSSSSIESAGVERSDRSPYPALRLASCSLPLALCLLAVFLRARAC